MRDTTNRLHGMCTYTGKDKPFFDGYERAIGIIRRHGWNNARDTFNEQYPHNWKPSGADAWQYSKGYLAALMETM